MTTQVRLLQQEITVDTAQPHNFIPTQIVEVELSQVLPAIPVLKDRAGQLYRKALCIVRLHSQPLGVVELALANGTLNARALAQSIWQTLGEQVNTHLLQDGLAPVSGLGEQGISTSITPACQEERERSLANAPFASVIVATRNRPELLQRCLKALLALRYPHYEIIVVDNAPSTTATADLIERAYGHTPQVRYVREDRQGLSHARNRGIQEARGEILAITDDDVVVDANWLLALAHGLQVSEKVVCVSGLVLPMELETRAQGWFEQYGGYSKGFTRRLFDVGEHHPKTPLFPYAAGQLGTGANIAFKAAHLRAMGGFDPALGAGTLARGGEDLFIFFQTIMQGHTIVYEPAALLYHPHHRDYTGLCKQMYSYGMGLTAYLTKSVLDQPILLFDLIKKLPYGTFFIFSSRSPKNGHKSTSYPKELTRLERLGMLYGPLAYLRSRWALRRAHSKELIR
jgi:glycosyltransferase involved in cell wall biosynthesis